jgi:hypothetical protein
MREQGENKTSIARVYFDVRFAQSDVKLPAVTNSTQRDE